MIALKRLTIIVCIGVSAVADAADPRDLPLISIADIERSFVGAFKVDYRSPTNIDNFHTAYANGRIAYNSSAQTVFIDSHVYADGLAEFKIPSVLSDSTDPESLPNADVVQDFSTVIDRTSTANTQGMDNFGGMIVVGGELLVQVYDYYDAPAQDTNTTLIIRDHNQLATSAVDGFFDLAGSGKTVNYVSPIPRVWQDLLQGDYLAGNGGGIPINSRLSIGPSLFAFDMADFTGRSSGNITSKEWLAYDLSKPLSATPGDWDGYNDSGSNTLWTHESGAWYGFIPAGTRSFVVLGNSGMHESGGGYKITQSNGRLCGGPCPYDSNDYESYYWLYDLNELLTADPSETVLPYEHGEFNSRYAQIGYNGMTGTVSGGAYDPDTGKLLLLLKSATRDSNSGSPVVSVYQLAEQSEGLAIPSILDLLLDD